MRILPMILLIVTLRSVAVAESPGVDWEHRAYLMAGEYTVIGRKPDSKVLYSGRISFHANGEKLDFVKTIGQVTIRGTAFIDRIPDINGVFLKLAFVQNGQAFEGRFQFMDGCDGTFRFTGYVGSTGHTNVTGLEAFFPDPTPASR